MASLTDPIVDYLADLIRDSGESIFQSTKNPSIPEEKLAENYEIVHRIAQGISDKTPSRKVEYFRKYLLMVELSAACSAARKDCISYRDFMDLFNNSGEWKVPLENAVSLKKDSVKSFMNLRNNSFEMLKQKGLENIIP